MAALVAGMTRSNCSWKALFPHGCVLSKPSFCRKNSLSTDILERVSSASTSACISFSFSSVGVDISMNTAQCTNGSLSLCICAIRFMTSFKFDSAIISFWMLPEERFIRFLLAALEMIFLSSAGVTCLV